MRSHKKRKSSKAKYIIVSNDQEIPDGYVPVAGATIKGKELQVVLPEKLVRDKPELANKLIEQAEEELFSFMSENM